jgi:hypothetical protein
MDLLCLFLFFIPKDQKFNPLTPCRLLTAITLLTAKAHDNLPSRHGPVKFKKAVTPDESRQANYEL